MLQTIAIIVIAANFIAFAYDAYPASGMVPIAGPTLTLLALGLRWLLPRAHDTRADRDAIQTLMIPTGLALTSTLYLYVGGREGVLSLIAGILIIGWTIFNDPHETGYRTHDHE